jgi:hypothetical protein
MGNYFESIVDVEATEVEAPALAEKVLAWMVSEGVVVAERTDCVLGSEGGHRAGPRYDAAVTAPPRSGGVDGVHAEVRRGVYDPGQGGVELVTCPRCAQSDRLQDEQTYEPTARWESVVEAIERWYGGGPGELTCDHCRQVIGLNDWCWEPPFAFGCVAITFWNWPLLRDSFVADVVRVLGHRVVRVAGKR